MERIDLTRLEPNVFREYFGIIRKRTWLILLLMLATMIVAVAGSFLARPVFESKTVILVETKPLITPTSSSVSTFQLPAFSKAEILQTQTLIIQSRPLIEEVVLTLGLHERIPPNDLTEAVKKWLKDTSTQISRFLIVEVLGGVWKPKPGDPVPAAIDDLMKRVTVAPVVQSDLIEIKVQDYDPVMAERIANTLAQAYIDRNASFDSLRADTSYQLLGEQLAVIEPQLEASEDDLKEFKVKQGYLSIQTKATNLATELAKLESDYNQIVLQRKATEEQIKHAKTWLLSFSDREEAVTTSSSKAVDTINTQLKLQLLNLESQLAGLVAYQGQAPSSEESAKAAAQVAQVSAEINRVKQQLPDQATEQVSTSSSLSTQPNPVYQNLVTQLVQYEVNLAGLQAKEAALLELIGQHQTALTQLAEEELELQRLTRAVTVNTNIYNTLLQDKEQAQASAVIKLPNVRFVEAAAVPQEPIYPKIILNVGAALIAGLILGIGLAFWFDYLDESIRSPRDVETYLDLPLVGTVPTLKS